MSESKPTLAIIDTFGYFFRNFYALPKLTSKDGFPTGVLLGFVNLINQLFDDKSTHLIFALEGQGEKWRKSIYPAYKANRKEADKDLIAQIEVAIRWIGAMNLSQIAIDGFEADDAIATLCRLAKRENLAVRIVSVDKDLYQLIDSNTHIFDPAKKREIHASECFEKFGVNPAQFVDYQSLVGDTSDNIIGVIGIGAKSAQSLISEFGSLDNLYANLAQNTPKIPPKMATKISAGKDSAYLSQKLVRLRDDLLQNFAFDSCVKPAQNPLFLIESELEKYNINILDKIRKKTKNPLDSAIFAESKIKNTHPLAPSAREGGQADLNSAKNRGLIAESNENKSVRSTQNSPASWCKKSESKGAVVPPADFLLEADKRGSPPKSEKAAAFWRVGGAGRGVQPFLRKESSESNLKNGKNIADSAIQIKNAESYTESQNLNRDSSLTSFAQNDKMDCHDSLTQNLAMTKSNADSANRRISHEIAESSDFTIKSHLKDSQKICILDSAKLFKIIDSIPKDALVAFDTETDSLDSNTANIVGFSFAWELNCGFYVPLRHSYLGAPSQIAHTDAKAALCKLFAHEIIAHNAKFDIKIIWHNFALDISRIIDTMLLAWLNSSDSPCGLDFLAKTHLNYTTIKFDEVVPKKASFDMVAIDKATDYAAQDALCTLALYKYFCENLSADMFDIAKHLEYPIIKILAKMEGAGIGVDTEFFGSLRDELESKISRLSKEIFTLCEAEFNLNSPKQLSEILFDKLGLKKGRALKNSAFSTDEKTLESLRDSHAVIPLLLDYREISKLLNTYVAPFLSLNKNRKLYTSFVQTGTSTGRLASKNPNLQNIPVRSDIGRKIRQGFIAKQGFSFVSADYSQIELRLLAHFSRDSSLCEAFESGKDIHLETAIKLFGDETSAKAKRNIAKSINFGLIYGMGARKLSQNLKIPQNEAKSYIDSYFTKFPTIRDFLADKEREILQNGYAESLLGHRRKFDFTRTADYERAAFLREGINAIFQGSAADLIKLAMIECDKFFTQEYKNGEVALLLQIHDELIFEVRDDLVESVAQKIKAIMEGAYRLNIPLTCGISVGKNWAELK
ncbi:DNA polymerase I [Helicobacter sp. 23-1044]